MNTCRSPRVVVPHPDRIRRISETCFGWLDARLRSHGWLGHAIAMGTFHFETARVRLPTSRRDSPVKPAMSGLE